ncbi:phosphate-repressible phosphate permease, partial [Globomyces pollinis-pini]
LGVKLTKLSPAKGLAIDLASALVVIITAYLKIPISSTQTQVGAIIGVSLISGKKSMLGSTNWKTMLTIAFVWVMTLVVSLGLAFGLFSFIAWSPK